MTVAIQPTAPPAPSRWTHRRASRPGAASNRRLVVASNRLAPVERGKASTGGLAVAVQSALDQSGGIWFGWSGQVVEDAVAEPHIVSAGALTYATVDLSRQDYEEYYNGYANRVLWPLFHFRSDFVEFRRRDLEGYLRVNRNFAAHLAPLLIPSDLVWVHDYHFIPLGRELRRLGMTQPIGFFLHTPFPPVELLRILPNHRDIMRALCEYDVVGFQTTGDLDGFRDYLLREFGASDLGEGRLRGFDRVIRAEVFPIGIDVDTVAELAAVAAESRQIRRLHESLGERALIIGVDRLDYSKGLLARFEAFERLVERFPETRGQVTFMQIAPPSRSEVPEYLEIRRGLEAAAGHINGRFAEFDWTPLRYLNKSFNQRTLTGFFGASRIGLVTPLRDGMNLVAKEFVASQDPSDPGVLILSCFAGAASELGEALIVNPFDRMEMTEAMHRGLAMPLDERQERWRAMMKTLRRNDITAWRQNFVDALSQVGR
ncbi:MAG: alpha,alpha-trehalose-phosphate synthase (UDP-forming) [Alphaproteobacteria bacterium]|nr:alpha,alpha-trehalose-phosphate synthase (UDP-forming) [Alphaproteobacteria bacterium]